MVEDKRDVFRIFRKSGEDFPMLERALIMEPDKKRMIMFRTNALAAMSNVDGMEDGSDLQVLWTEADGKGNVRIFCQMSPQNGTVADSCLARIRDDSGKVVAEHSFVNFGKNMAIADLEVPERIFDKCILTLEKACIGKDVRFCSGCVPLSRYDTRALKADYQILAPCIKRAGHQKICISYYRYSDDSNYDYVYKDGLSKNQMYLEGEGRITLRGVDVKKPQINLGVDGGRGMVWYKHPYVAAQDNVIEYRNNPEWNVPLWDVYTKDVYGNGQAKYLLMIQAQRVDTEKLISLLITNIPELLASGDYDSIKELPRISVYLDCFGAGTKIRMADGTDKEIEAIRPGERVLTEGGGEAVVKSLEEQAACRRETVLFEDGRSIYLTEGHGVYTSKGVWPAHRLQQGQQVMTEQGHTSVQEIVLESDGNYPMYALFLENHDQAFFANGILVHDSENEGLFDDYDWVREDLPEEWRRDYDNALKAGIVYGR